MIQVPSTVNLTGSEETSVGSFKASARTAPFLLPLANTNTVFAETMTREAIVNRSYGGLGPTIASTLRDDSNNAGWFGKSDAMCPSSPTDRSNTSIRSGNTFW